MGKNLVIKGADFSANALPEQLLVKALTVCQTTSTATMRASSNQATVLMYKASLNNTKWGVDPVSDFANKAKYELNQIPYGAKKVKATDTVKQKQISIALYDENYSGLFLPAWSGSGNYSQEINIENYPSAKYFSLNYQSLPADISTLTIEFTF